MEIDLIKVKGRRDPEAVFTVLGRAELAEDAHCQELRDLNAKMLAAFRKLIDAGGSVLVIEHNMDVIKTADWIIDLGPEGGDRGGKIVVAGPPETVAETANSYTGRWLGRILQFRENSQSNGHK